MARRILTSTLLLPALLGAQEPEVRTTARDRTGLAITVYADGRALVQDTRRVTLPAGRCRLSFADVSDQMKPASALFRVERGQPGLKVLERNFEFDLITPIRLVEKSLGLPVRVSSNAGGPMDPGILRSIPHADLWSPPRTPLEAQLNPVMRTPLQRIAKINPLRRKLVKAETDVLVETPSGFLSIPLDNVQPTTLPEGLRSQPTLVQQVESKAIGSQEVQLSYLTEGITWQATYRASLDPEGRRLDLSAFLTMSNKTVCTFPDSRLMFLAGDLNRATEDPDNSDPDNTGLINLDCTTVTVCASSPVGEEKVSEFLLFSLPRTTTLGAGQEKQIALFQVKNIPVEHRWSAAVQLSSLGPDETPFVTPTIWLASIENRKGGPLGRPLPRGQVYVTQGDLVRTVPESLWVRSGEHNPPYANWDVEDTPVGETALVSLGEDPLVQVNPEPVRWRQETAWELFFRNAGQTFKALFRSTLSAHAPQADVEEEGLGPRHAWRGEVDIKVSNGRNVPVVLELDLVVGPGCTLFKSSVPFRNGSESAFKINPRLAPHEARTIHLTILKP